MKVGQIVAKKGIVIADGTILGIGDTFFVEFAGKSVARIVESISRSVEVCALTGKYLKTGTVWIHTSFVNDDGAFIDGQWINVSTIFRPSECFSTERAPLSITIANGKRVGVDDFVWIWRRSGTTASIVQKKVVAIRKEFGVTPFRQTQTKKISVQCTYLDNHWPVKEDPSCLYATKEDALAAKPEWAKALNVALFRAGQLSVV